MKKVTIPALRQMKASGERITMLTAYDATFARLFDNAGVDALLVGDSLGMVVQGHESTLPVTMDDILYHLRAVKRGTRRAHIVGDLPFMSYQASVDEAVRNAGRLVAEGGAESVKLEGGAEFADVVRRITRAGVPVMGHIGLTPQFVHSMGGFKVQGRDDAAARRLLNDALELERAGAYALVLEGIPVELSAQITRRLSIPTIGIGAGVSCDGQVLVCYDLLGLNPDFVPKFVKCYADGASVASDAARSFVDEVRSGAFPADEHSFHARSLRLYPASIDSSRLTNGVNGAGVTHGVEAAGDNEDGLGRVYGAPV